LYVLNCAGNFWIPKADFGATFPVTAVVTLGGFSRVMTTQMHRDGACAGCHANPASAASPGHLWVLPEGTEPPDSTCSSDETPHGVEGVLPECTDTSQECVAPFPTYTHDLAPIGGLDFTSLAHIVGLGHYAFRSIERIEFKIVITSVGIFCHAILQKNE